MQENQQGDVGRNPSKTYRPGQGGTPAYNPLEPSKEDETAFDSENNTGEINPGKLDHEEVDLNGSGDDSSKGHQPYELKNREGTGRSLREGHDESNFSADASIEKYGKNTAAQRGRDSVKKDQKGILIGQGGYGSSGTSGTNSGGSQGYQSGLGSAGSQNGSTGYNAGSVGTDNHEIHPERPNKEVDIHQLGKGIKNDDGSGKETRQFSGS